MGWTVTDLSTRPGQVLGRGNPVSYLFAGQGTQHCIVLEFSATSQAINHALIEWVAHPGDQYDAIGLMIGVDAPLALSNPAAYVFRHEGTQHVLYSALNDFGHIHELYWDGDWHHNELIGASAGAPPAASRAHGYDFEPSFESTQHVVYRGLEGHVHELARSHSSWNHFDLSADAGGPPAVAEPFGYAFDQQGTQHVVYRGADNNGTSIHELWWNRSGWHHEPLTQQTGAPPTASEPFGYVFSWDGTQHVDYVGTNGHIYELWWNPTGWHVEDLTAHTGAPLAHFGGAGVWGYPFDPAPGVPNPTQHVLYRGVDSHIHELWWDSTGWHHNDLHGVPGTPLASGDPTGFAHTGKGTQHVFFVSDTNHVIALQWRP